MMSVVVITLAENTVAMPRFLADWGLSMLVKADDCTILFDTGFSFATVYNAGLYNINLSSLDKVVLSHGHLDHTGGLREILRRTGPTEVIAHPSILDAKYLKMQQPLSTFFGVPSDLAEDKLAGIRIPYQEQEEYCGIPFTRDELESLGARFRFEKVALQLSENIFTTGEIALKTGYETVGPVFFTREENGFHPDALLDDLALIVKTAAGLLILLGCSHRGMINTIRQAQHITGEERVHTVVGGTHLVAASDERIKETVKDLQEIGVQRIGVSHCTGFRAATILAEVFKERFFLNNAGTIFSLNNGLNKARPWNLLQ